MRKQPVEVIDIQRCLSDDTGRTVHTYHVVLLVQVQNVSGKRKGEGLNDWLGKAGSGK